MLVRTIQATRAFIGMLVMLSASIVLHAAPVATPADPRPDPDACTLLSSMDLEPLLLSGEGGEIDGYNYYPAPGMVTCKWFALPRNHAADAVRRTAMLAFYHIADAARAQAQLDRQPRGDTRPSLAVDGHGDDAVARPSPTIVLARHGADVAVIDAGGAELTGLDRVETRYLLDALALKAAGATVKNPPWVSPNHVARMVPLAPTGSIAGWTPPPQRTPTGAALFEPIIHWIKIFADWRFAVMVVLIPAAAAMFERTWGRRSRRDAVFQNLQGLSHEAPRKRWQVWVGALLIAIAVINLVFGDDIATSLVDTYGATGAATVTGSFATATQYNHENVIGYRVLIGTIGGKVVPAEFRTDSFNVLGLGDTIYPGVGDVFTVRYLPQHPQDFVIRNDDESPWARKLACARLGAWRGEAMRKAAAVPKDAAFRREFVRASDAERGAGCGETKER